MEFQQLRYFITLARERHFQRSASECNVTQPTLSQSIAKLEKELGRPLFERSSRRVSLTAAGAAFLPHATAALDALRAGRERLRQDEGELSGTVRVGTIPTIGPYLMPAALSRLRREAPRLKVELYEETTSVLLEHLKRSRVDLGVLSTPIRDKGLSSLSIVREPFFVAVSSKHPLAARRSVSLAAVHRERLLILQEGHCFSDQTLEFCKLSRRDPHVSFEGSSLTSVLQMAASGEGVTLVPRLAVSGHAHPGLRFLPVRPEKPSREIGVVWRLTMPLDRSQRFVLRVIEETLRAGR